MLNTCYSDDCLSLPARHPEGFPRLAWPLRGGHGRACQNPVLSNRVSCSCAAITAGPPAARPSEAMGKETHVAANGQNKQDDSYCSAIGVLDVLSALGIIFML